MFFLEWVPCTFLLRPSVRSSCRRQLLNSRDLACEVSLHIAIVKKSLLSPIPEAIVNAEVC